ncbi:Myb-like DNA-binding domain containing protein [Trichomonas vaginalis G3]|uniref:Myb-like DNA-binding domain containing protein n=1 Tax=Trichomonas vaginalis (strain ATCC PRA-98 / G3) TaxID=412133 RepID=A2EBF5_TRIV3|nr:positive regulation of histone acetylation [Trichomonas vaginalis G3]EAY09985.1 Myb-like DNA-binding domain containing protein [Trichomonas vaginalis G3]KAI5535065.1 positive regulation of histone acetylation [Trichomonas vaginalis G3]|eukprot:XP_001322208.1 Myb-like DNA-binding domain containing protein [Trichomonas vaginalis G3]
MFGQKKAPRDDTETLPKTRRRIRCSVCKRPIQEEKCLRCTNCPQYYTCVECFSDGLVAEKHLTSHQNVVMDPEPLTGLTDDWNSNEELLLLSGIQKFGIGNWHVISDYIGTKSSIQCESHYFGTFIDCPTAPLPDPLIQEAVPLPPPPSYQVKDKKLKSLPSDRSPKNRIRPNDYATPGEYCGWMPYRHEFEIEYHHDAEELVSNVDFMNNCDTMEQFKSNLANLTAYNAQLAERVRRTKLIEEWDLHHLEKNAKQEQDIDSRFLGGETPSEKTIDSLLLPFSQYYPKDRLTAVARALHNIDAIKSTLDKRLEWIRIGITSPEDGELYEQLSNLVKNNTIPPENVDKWNQIIKNYNIKCITSRPPNEDYIDDQEKDLCTANNIDRSLFIAIKELFVREIISGGHLTIERAMDISQQPETVVKPILEYMEHNGWN